MQVQLFDDDRALSFFQFLEKQNLSVEYFPRKNKALIYNEGHQKLIGIRNSINTSFDQYSKSLIKRDINHTLVILIRSGLASVGLIQGNELVHHKVFRAYTVRQKQGKSQIKHLKTKGKSRAGSRVRLASTMEFFQDIGNRVNQHLESYPVDQIALTCSETLLPYFFNENKVLKLEMRDQRIFKIPKHITSPTLESLIEIKDLLLKNEIQVFEYGQAYFQEFQNLNSEIIDEDEDLEDW